MCVAEQRAAPRGCFVCWHSWSPCTPQALPGWKPRQYFGDMELLSYCQTSLGERAEHLPEHSTLAGLASCHFEPVFLLWKCGAVASSGPPSLQRLLDLRVLPFLLKMLSWWCSSLQCPWWKVALGAGEAFFLGNQAQSSSQPGCGHPTGEALHKAGEPGLAERCFVCSPLHALTWSLGNACKNALGLEKSENVFASNIWLGFF